MYLLAFKKRRLSLILKLSSPFVGFVLFKFDKNIFRPFLFFQVDGFLVTLMLCSAILLKIMKALNAYLRIFCALLEDELENEEENFNAKV